MGINGIVIVGPPASGKSTIGKQVAEKMNMVYISSGDIARNMAKLCDTTKNNLQHGLLAEETQMRKNIYNALYGCNMKNKSFVLDGFPRNADQYFWLIERFPSLRFYFVDVDVEECAKRSYNRNRADDNVIKERMNYYMTSTVEMINIMSTHEDVIGIRNNKADDAVIQIKEHLITKVKL